MATKTTKAELESRISQIYKLIIIGSSRQKILQYASKKWGELSDRTVDCYIASARKLMMQNLEIDRTVALAEELELRREIIFQAMQDKKYQIALQASDSRAKLRGLFMSLELAIDTVTAHGYEVSDPTEIADTLTDTLPTR